MNDKRNVNVKMQIKQTLLTDNGRSEKKKNYNNSKIANKLKQISKKGSRRKKYRESTMWSASEKKRSMFPLLMSLLLLKLTQICV